MAYNKNASNKQKRTPRDIESQANEEIAYQQGYARKARQKMKSEQAVKGPRTTREERAQYTERSKSYDRVAGPEPKSEQGAMSRFLEGMGLLRKFARKKQKGWQDLNNISVD